MRICKRILVFAATTSLGCAYADDSDIATLQILDLSFEQSRIRDMDFNGNGKIDKGREAHAVVRFVNESVFNKFDANFDGKITGSEAEDYVAQELQPMLDRLDDYYKLVAYPAADERFKDGIAVSDEKELRDNVPLIPRFSKIELELGYGQTSEAGKDAEEITSGLSYEWSLFAYREVPIAATFELSFSRENTFLLTETNKVERWTIEPAKLTIGKNSWPIQPTIGLGYAFTETENVPSGGDPESMDSNQFVWEFGVAVPVTEWADLTLAKSVRFDKFVSGKESDDATAGLKINFRKLLSLP